MKLVRLPVPGAEARPSVEAPRLGARAEGAARDPWTLVAKPLRELLSALDDVRDAADTDARLLALDRLAVRLVAAIAPFLEEPPAMLPVQRALLLMPGKVDGSVGLGGLQRALREIDDRIGPELGGFSRLLDNALSAGEVLDVARLRASHVDEELRPLAEELEAAARELGALDDLSHALSTPAELAAAAIVLEALLDLLEGAGVIDEGGRDELLGAWLSHRGLDERLAALCARRDARAVLTAADVERAGELGLSRPLALWLLACRLSAKERLETAPDRAELDELLARARLMPVEVFDVASLWPELHDE